MVQKFDFMKLYEHGIFWRYLFMGITDTVLYDPDRDKKQSGW